MNLQEWEIDELFEDIREPLYCYGKEATALKVLNYLEAMGWNKEQIINIVTRYMKENRKGGG